MRGGERGRKVGSNAPLLICPALMPPPPQGFFRIIKNQGGGDPSPKTPSPPHQTKVTIVGKKRNLQ